MKAALLTRCTDLVPVDLAAGCPSCGAELVEVAWEEPALVRGGGYGETRRTVERACWPCGWSLVVAVESVRPDRRSRA